VLRLFAAYQSKSLNLPYLFKSVILSVDYTKHNYHCLW